MRFQKLLKDPSLHFLFIGLVVYTVIELISPTVAPDEIRISSSQQQKLAEIWTRQWGRVPTEKEMGLLIQTHIKEEILYRKALAMGLDKDDELIRRRLIHKISFLVLDDDRVFSPTENQMQKWFARHKDQFRRHGIKKDSAEAYPDWAQIKPLVLEMMKKEHRTEQNRVKLQRWKKDYRIRVENRDRLPSHFLSAGISGKEVK
jgi:hypothetical protein